MGALGLGRVGMFGFITFLACAVGSWLLYQRFARLRAAREEVHSFGGTPALTPAEVSIIVPARNEAHNLPTLLESLRALSPAPLEIIVVDDHSSDGTAEIARRHGAHVVTPGALPDGYVGKTWACLAGAAVARGDGLLFTDADTWHAPDSLARSVDALADPRVGLVSIVPTHRLQATWEHLQGVFHVLLLLAARAGAAQASNYANGQYLLFPRAAYQRLGEHHAVRGYVAEDLAFVRAARTVGHGVRILWAPGALRARMYPEGFRAFFAGWRRNFREGMSSGGASSVLEVSVTIAWLLGAPILLVSSGMEGHWSSAIWLLIYGATVALLARIQGRLGPFKLTSAFAYPLFACVFVAVALSSALDAACGTPIVWRGRRIGVRR